MCILLVFPLHEPYSCGGVSGISLMNLNTGFATAVAAALTAAVTAAAAAASAQGDERCRVRDELAGPFRKLQECARNVARVMVESKLPVDEEEYVGKVSQRPPRHARSTQLVSGRVPLACAGEGECAGTGCCS